MTVSCIIDVKSGVTTLRSGEHDLNAVDAAEFRDGLITIRDGALKEGSAEWAVYLSHMIVGWGMMAEQVFGQEYVSALELLEKTKQSAADTARGTVSTDTKGGEPDENPAVQGDAPGHGLDGGGAPSPD